VPTYHLTWWSGKEWICVPGRNLDKEIEDLKPEVWITVYPIPFEKKELILE